MRAIAFYSVLSLLIAFPAYADQRAVDLERGRLQREGKAPLTTREESDLASRGWRNRRPAESGVPVRELVRPSDYVNEKHRGTIEHSPAWKNYAFHKVSVPNGTVIRNQNFFQQVPNTEAFDRLPGNTGHNLTFIDCNLVNVKTYPDWTIIGCNTAQLDIVGLDQYDPETGEELTDGVYVARRSEDVPAQRQKPARVKE